MQRTGSDLGRLVNQRKSSAGSWTESESPVVSPSASSVQLPPCHISPLLIKTDSTEDPVLGVTTPLSSGACSASGSAVSFTVGGEMGGDMMGEDDDGDGDDAEKGLTKKDIHTLNEQRRRDLIKHGYATLSEIVPTCQNSSNTKLSRATLLQKTIDYIIFLQKQSSNHADELEKLQREVKALEIMKENYEQIARAHQHAPTNEAPQVPDHVKFLVFQSIADQLFQSFNSSISVTSFPTLSSCIISWLEEYCKPQSLRELVIGNLQRVNALGVSPVFNVPHPPEQQPRPSQLQMNTDQSGFTQHS